MTPVDAQQLRLLKRLRQAGDRPLGFAELRDDGIDFPATVVGELEMCGYAIERVYEQGANGWRALVPSRTSRHDGSYRRSPTVARRPLTAITGF